MRCLPIASLLHFSPGHDGEGGLQVLWLVCGQALKHPHTTPGRPTWNAGAALPVSNCLSIGANHGGQEASGDLHRLANLHKHLPDFSRRWGHQPGNAFGQPARHGDKPGRAAEVESNSVDRHGSISPIFQATAPSEAEELIAEMHKSIHSQLTTRFL